MTAKQSVERGRKTLPLQKVVFSLENEAEAKCVDMKKAPDLLGSFLFIDVPA